MIDTDQILIWQRIPDQSESGFGYTTLTSTSLITVASHTTSASLITRPFPQPQLLTPSSINLGLPHASTSPLTSRSTGLLTTLTFPQTSFFFFVNFGISQILIRSQTFPCSTISASRKLLAVAITAVLVFHTFSTEYQCMHV
jgi:hypothetical protein